MRPFFLLILCCVLSAQCAFAQDPGDYFLKAYNSCTDGERSETSGDFKRAAQMFQKTLGICEEITQRWPEWNPPIVDHRRKKAQEGLARVSPRVNPNDLLLPPPPSDLDDLPIKNEPMIPDNAPVDIPDNFNEPPKSPNRKGPKPMKMDQPGDILKELDDRIKGLQKDLADTKESLASERAERQKLEKDLKTANDRAEQATQEMTKLQNRATVIEEKYNDTLTDSKKTKQESAKLKSEWEKAQADLAAATAERQAADDVRVQIEGRLKKVSEQRTETVKLNADTEKRLNEMQAALTRVTGEKKQLQTRIEQMELQIRTVTAERDSARGEVSRLKEAQKQIDQIITERDKLKADLATAEQTIKRYKSEGLSKDQEIARLKTEVAAVRTELTKVQQQSADYQKQMLEVKDKLEKQSRELASVKDTSGAGSTERKRLFSENEVLRGIVLRQMREQARRDQMKKLVLGELKKLELDSKALTSQIEILGSPLVKLNREELKLFKNPVITVSEAEMSVSAAKSEPDATPETAASVESTPPKSKDDLPVLGSAPPEGDLPKRNDPPPQDSAPKTLSKPVDAGSTPPGTSSPAAPETGLPSVPQELMDQARQAKEDFERGNFADSEKIYVRMLSKAPNNVYVLSNLGVVRFRAGKLKLAEEAFRKAIAVSPEDAFSHCTLGIVLYSMNKYDDAVNSLTKALALNNRNATAHNYLGITAIQKGWAEAGLKELETAVQIDPKYADALFNLAVAYATQTPPNKEKAREFYKRATEQGAEPDTALETLIN